LKNEFWHQKPSQKSNQRKKWVKTESKEKCIKKKGGKQVAFKRPIQKEMTCFRRKCSLHPHAMARQQRWE
jgi:hypothetical protein